MVKWLPSSRDACKIIFTFNTCIIPPTLIKMNNLPSFQISSNRSSKAWQSSANTFWFRRLIAKTKTGGKETVKQLTISWRSWPWGKNINWIIVRLNYPYAAFLLWQKRQKSGTLWLCLLPRMNVFCSLEATEAFKQLHDYYSTRFTLPFNKQKWDPDLSPNRNDKITVSTWDLQRAKLPSPSWHQSYWVGKEDLFRPIALENLSPDPPNSDTVAQDTVAFVWTSTRKHFKSPINWEFNRSLIEQT